MRGKPGVPPKLEMSSDFPSSCQHEGSFPCFIGKGIPAFWRNLSGVGLKLTLERNSRGRATISKDSIVPMHSRYTCLPCTDSMVTPRIDSKHDGSSDSPVAPRKNATNPYVNLTGKLTLLFQLERRADLHASTQDEA